MSLYLLRCYFTSFTPSLSELSSYFNKTASFSSPLLSIIQFSSLSVTYFPNFTIFFFFTFRIIFHFISPQNFSSPHLSPPVQKSFRPPYQHLLHHPSSFFCYLFLFYTLDHLTRRDNFPLHSPLQYLTSPHRRLSTPFLPLSSLTLYGPLPEIKVAQAKTSPGRTNYPVTWSRKISRILVARFTFPEN